MNNGERHIDVILDNHNNKKIKNTSNSSDN